MKERAYLEDEDGLAHEHAVSHGGVLGKAIDNATQRVAVEEENWRIDGCPEHRVMELVAQEQHQSGQA